MEVGADILVSGVVQGVGFRYFVCRIGKSLNLVGTAQNLPDGNVRIVVEGNRSAVEELIGLVKVGPRSASVANVAVRWVAPQHKFTEFRIL